ncbi:hypothetical protein [Thermococcus waiotapuensis]|uniref:Uncharacterized protein n=1 Tax=Thermococcus waiotapuensis TaxID=90909 RepID=A0AAE4NVB5_9EURY|nr:hypothetical protein [Thermococcus waiotapuensis]MDV3103306.1 hypothetical protein [Thermococcus waiotapuensis]
MKAIGAKHAVFLSFLMISTYFGGITALSINDRLQLAGGVFITSLHLLVLIGLWKGTEWSLSAGKYLIFLDLLFSILWMMLGVLAQGATLFALSSLVLLLLSDPEVEVQILGRT